MMIHLDLSFQLVELWTQVLITDDLSLLMPVIESPGATAVLSCANVLRFL